VWLLRLGEEKRRRQKETKVIPVFKNYLNKTINITQASHLLAQTGTTVPDNSMA